MTTPVSQPTPPSTGADTSAARRRTSARRRPRAKLVAALTIVGLYVVVALLAPWIRPYDPLAQDVVNSLQGPSGDHWFGTDELGRDVLSRVLTAARIDLPVAALATMLPCLLGTVLGLVAGYVGGWFDAVVMRVSDLLQAFPMYILMIVLVFSLGPGVRSLLISFTVIGWVVYARLIRSEVMRIRSSEYVVAAVTAGLSSARIIVRHVLPNTVKQSLVYLTSDLVFAVTALAAFSFLGFGVQQPTPEWGSMIAAAQPYIEEQPVLTIIPGLVVTVLALGFALLGDALQDGEEHR